jgi:branched-chain amino acid transport system substrate-binding protein
MITTSLDRDSKSPPMRKFIDDYEAKYKAPADMVAASTHTAINVAAEGLRRAGGDDPAKVRDAISALKDFQVATGRITFNELGEIYKAAQVQVIKGGKFRHFATIDDPVLLAAPTK